MSKDVKEICNFTVVSKMGKLRKRLTKECLNFCLKLFTLHVQLNPGVLNLEGKKNYFKNSGSPKN